LVREHAIESIAICFLFSYANPEHERRARALIEEHYPELRVSLSSDILPIIREYRRLSTTAIDAFVGPILSRYLSRLGDGLRQAGVTTPQVFIMQSNGGLMSIDVARANPVQTLLSGPAAGVIAGKHLAQISGSRNLVTFDVGGTSTDVAIIVDGEVSETSEGAIAGHDVSVLMSEISTIGAGGGTIARIGVDNRLKVGPDSAGARPGPACYGHGGTFATVTDANLLLGYLDPATYLGGRFSIDVERARTVIRETIAEPLGISVTEAAVGIVKLVNAAMEGELRVNLLQRGHDPRGFALVAIGGGGPLHAPMVGRSLGIESVIVPPYPGLGSAVGLLMTDIRHQYIHSSIHALSQLDPGLFDEMFDRLRQQALADAESEGSPLDEVSMQGLLDLRYRGQGYELSVPCDVRGLDDAARAEITDAFHAMHARHYGHAARDKVVEVVNFRLISTRHLPKLAFPAVAEAVPGELWRPKSRRPVYFEEYGDFVDCPIYDRWAGKRGQRIEGPAIIEQSDTTAIVLPGQIAEMGEAGLLVIRGKAAAAAECEPVVRQLQGVSR
jgi:N-methylhydantoinase A